MMGKSIATQDRRTPFKMPIHGKAYDIFQPLYDIDESKMNPTLFAPPQDFFKTFEERISWADTMVNKDGQLKKLTTTEHAKYMYIEMMKSYVSGTVFMDAELSVIPSPSVPATLDLNLAIRQKGEDWTYAGDTMTGWARLNNIRDLLTDIICNNIRGDYIETGVWRGGASIFAKAVMSALEEPDDDESTTISSSPHRISYVCDSFQGLPPGDRNLDLSDKNWDTVGKGYLEVASNIVANNFKKFGMLDSNVVFAKGFFNETMPPLSKQILSLSIMRLDGDMYESTVDVLYNLYDKLSIGGYVIMDDWFGFPSRTACEDFFQVHQINPDIIAIDNTAAYWKKTEHIEIQYWRYEQNRFKPEDVQKRE